MHEPVKSSIIPRNRYEFGHLLTVLGYRKAIEIGTDLGTFACHLLDHWNGELLCVDDFRAYEWNEYRRDCDKIIAATRLAKYGGRGRVVQATSDELSGSLPDWYREQLDFVYVDADHDYDSVLNDLNVWWPLITDRGMIAGHDYDIERHPDVVRAVDEFAAGIERTVYVVVGDEYCCSWFICKNATNKILYD